jgi:parafibromin
MGELSPVISFPSSKLHMPSKTSAKKSAAKKTAKPAPKAKPIKKAAAKPAAASAEAGESATKENSAAPPPPDRKRSSSKSDKHRSSSGGNRDKHGKKRPSSSSSHHKDRHEKNKRRSLVTNEQLFSDLNVVVDKRAEDGPGPQDAANDDDDEQQQLQQAKQSGAEAANEAIRKALSTKGFEVTPEMLEQHREKTEKEILAHEIPVGDSASVLRAASVGANLTRVLNLFMETMHPGKSGSGSKTKGGVVTPSTKKAMRPYLIGKKPIILVPKGMTAPITMLNAYDFFANARFIPRDVMMKNKALQANSKITTFTRKMPNVGLVEYELVDNPRKLQTREEWERVVAVLVLGHAWQFKDWPGKYSNPVDLFAKTFGFYVGMEGDKIPSDLEGWACQRGFVHRDKRGLDSVTHASFWNSLDEWMKIHRPELLPQPEN